MKTVAVTAPSPPDTRRMNPVCRPCGTPPTGTCPPPCVRKPGYRSVSLPSQSSGSIRHECWDSGQRNKDSRPGQMSPRKSFASQRGPETGHLLSLGVNDYMKVPDSHDPLGVMRTGRPWEKPRVSTLWALAAVICKMYRFTVLRYQYMLHSWIYAVAFSYSLLSWN